MTNEQLLENALDYIEEIVQDEDWICTGLHNIPEEYDYCADNCENLSKDCIKRYLKHYKKE